MARGDEWINVWPRGVLRNPPAPTRAALVDDVSARAGAFFPTSHGAAARRGVPRASAHVGREVRARVLPRSNVRPRARARTRARPRRPPASPGPPRPASAPRLVATNPAARALTARSTPPPLPQPPRREVLADPSDADAGPAPALSRGAFESALLAALVKTHGVAGGARRVDALAFESPRIPRRGPGPNASAERSARRRAVGVGVARVFAEDAEAFASAVALATETADGRACVATVTARAATFLGLGPPSRSFDGEAGDAGGKAAARGRRDAARGRRSTPRGDSGDGTAARRVGKGGE